jgi:hypothetical protein
MFLFAFKYEVYDKCQLIFPILVHFQWKHVYKVRLFVFFIKKVWYKKMRQNYLDLKTLIEEKYPYVVLRPPKVPFFELTITSKLLKMSENYRSCFFLQTLYRGKIRRCTNEKKYFQMFKWLRKNKNFHWKMSREEW